MRLGPNITPEGKIPFKDLIDVEFQTPEANDSVGSPPEVSKGVPSLFNPYAVVVFPSLGYGGSNLSVYNRIIDGGADAPGANQGNLFSPPGSQTTSGGSSIPSIRMLVEDTELALKTPYNYTDFLYCKYVGQIPNNQLITLRRFPAPTFDNLAVPGRLEGDAEVKNANIKTGNVQEQKEFFPIAQAVTWFGEETGNKLSEILSFTVNMNWKNVESEVNTAAGNEQGSEDSPAPGVAQFLGILTGQVNTPFATANSQYDPYNGGPYSHRVYGPVNVISKTYKRDRGLDFKQALTINFEYSLKSIGNINPKAAMLDLMSNMLALTYNNAAFWGGANRYFPQKPTYPFLGGKDGMNAWYRGEPAAFAKAVGSQISSGMKALSDTLAKLVADPISTLKDLAAGAAKLGMIEMGKGRAPSIVAMKALLTGEPIGEWHMVVGNPYNPIAKIGNLICTESKFQFNDIIGADNFPTELKVTITVEHGRPRDAGDIQSMFNQGQGRIYYPPKALGGADFLNTTASTQNSKNDTSWKVGGGGGGYSKNTASVGIFTGSASEFDGLLGTLRASGDTVADTAKQAIKTADLMFLRLASTGKKNESK
jgi:hypothetical protein